MSHPTEPFLTADEIAASLRDAYHNVPSFHDGRTVLAFLIGSLEAQLRRFGDDFDPVSFEEASGYYRPDISG